MLEASNNVLPENKSSCTDFLDSNWLFYATNIVESTRHARTEDPNLLALIKHRMESVEAELKRGLIDRNFFLENSQEVALIGGTRIEKVLRSLPPNLTDPL